MTIGVTGGVSETRQCLINPHIKESSSSDLTNNIRDMYISRKLSKQSYSLLKMSLCQWQFLQVLKRFLLQHTEIYFIPYLSIEFHPVSLDASRDTICPTLCSISMATWGSAPSRMDRTGERRVGRVWATSRMELSLPATRPWSRWRIWWAGSREVMWWVCLQGS